MRNIDSKTFIATYSSADEPRIRFDWNGEHAEKFVDANAEFRQTIREAVLHDPDSAPIELVRDLFRAETQFSREAWGIVDGVSILAESFLRRGGVHFLDDYLEGKFQSFDASLGSAFPYDLSLARTMLDAVRHRLSTEPNSQKLGLWQAGEKLFRQWLADFEK